MAGGGMISLGLRGHHFMRRKKNKVDVFVSAFEETCEDNRWVVRELKPKALQMSNNRRKSSFIKEYNTNASKPKIIV